MATIRPNNLYRSGWVEVFDNEEKLLYRKQLKNKVTLTDKYHVLRREEMLDSIAYQYYKNITSDPSKLWWVIADANEIFNPLDLDDFIGTQLIIPNLVKAELRI